MTARDVLWLSAGGLGGVTAAAVFTPTALGVTTVVLMVTSAVSFGIYLADTPDNH